MSKLRKPDLTATECMSIIYQVCLLATTYLFYVLFCAAPPVTFADIPEEDLFKSVVEKEQLVLSCEVSRPDGVVQWYKDGAETQTSDNVAIQAEDTKRSLTLHSAKLSDTGTYTCRAGDNVLIFKVTIRGNNLTKTSTKYTKTEQSYTVHILLSYPYCEDKCSDYMWIS